MKVGQRCPDCGRKLRPYSVKAADWPGTTQVGPGGVCLVCARAAKAGRRVVPYMKRPEKCVLCGRPVRGKNTRAADAPGTVQYASKGKCNSCYMGVYLRRAKATPRPAPVAECRGCERPTRASNHTADEYPGTVVRRRNGFCGRCVSDGTEAAVLAANTWRTRLKAA